MIETDTIELGLIVLVSLAVAGLARYRGWQPPLVLLAAGLLFGLAPIGPDAPADPEFLLVMILAPLVFGEALSSSIIDLRRVSRPVMALAVGLVVLGAFAVGYVAVALVPGLPLAAGLALGAILGPTDAVAVAATAKAAALPRRLVHILEGESLVNDGTALTLLRIFATAAVAGSVAGDHIAWIAATSIVGGLVVGAFGGWLLIQIARRSRDTTVATSAVLLAPFPLYLGAEHIEGSGILAVVIAALLLAHATSSGGDFSGRLESTSVWRIITFILQSVAFFVVGIEVPTALASLTDDDRASLFVLVPLILITLIIARAVFVFAMGAVARDRPDPKALVIIAWAGARGPISGLAAFTLPLTLTDGLPFPHRNLLISITFCVVLASLLIAPSLKPLARALNLMPDDDTDVVRRVRVALAEAALDRLTDIEQRADRTERPLDPDVLTYLRGNAERRLNRAAKLAQGAETRSTTSATVVWKLSRQMLHAEQEELLRLRDEEGLPDSLMRELQAELDVRLRALHTTPR